MFAATKFGDDYDKFYYGYQANDQPWGFYPKYYSGQLIGTAREYRGKMQYSGERLFLMSPMFFGGAKHIRSYRGTIAVSRDVELTLNEVKQVQNIRCELKHDGPLPPKLPAK